MGYDRDTRKWGDGFTAYLAHSGNVAPYYGERDILTMVSAATDLGAYSEGAEFDNEPEILEDEITQELYPIQIGVVGAKAIFKCTMSLGDATKLAIAAGYSAPGSSSGTGTSAYTVLLGAVKPVWLTLLHSVKNVHAPTYYDRLYIPRAQCSSKLTIKTDKKGIRQAEVTFMCAPPQQDGSTGTPTSEDFRLKVGGVATDLGGCAMAFHEHA